MVARESADWQEASQLWISNGQQDCRGTIQLRLWLDEGADASTPLARTQTDEKVAQNNFSKESNHE